MSILITSVKNYVQIFLEEHLSPELVFHSLIHTREVVQAAIEIAQHSDLNDSEFEILIVAAWFHDCGYVYSYSNHEEESKKLAKKFLRELDVRPDFIYAVLDCIEATRFPQCPKNNMERILCDADLYHFARTGYPRYAEAIRVEFDIFLKKRYSDEDWHRENCSLLLNHRYWTQYGKTTLERFKQVNMVLMGCKLSHIEIFKN